jgi:hypothetical protein
METVYPLARLVIEDRSADAHYSYQLPKSEEKGLDLAVSPLVVCVLICLA